jgi:hypothetical protein
MKAVPRNLQAPNPSCHLLCLPGASLALLMIALEKKLKGRNWKN